MTTPEKHHAEDREADAVPLRPLLLIIAVVTVVGIAASAWSWSMARSSLPVPVQPQTIPAQVAGVETGLISHASAALDLRAQQAQSLSRYEPIPGEPGFARIPIDVAKAAWLRQQEDQR